jgi:predicted secreted protein
MHKPCPFRSCSLFLLLVTLAGTSGFAAAQNNYDLGILNPGEVMLNLDASEQIEVQQDTLHASLYYAAQGRDRVALQDEVNRKMTAALELLDDSEVEHATQQYNVYQVQADRPTRGDIENPVWRAQQNVTLTSKDSAALLELAAELQAMGLTMGSLNYSLSPQRYEVVADSLMEAALTKLRNRANATAAALGKGSAELVEVTLNASSNFFARNMTTMAISGEAAMDMTVPVAEPGMTTVMLSVSARAILLP